MKVIFIKNLKNQGKVNDIKEVSDGYATNFLIKNGYAVKYTKTSLDRLNTDLENDKLLDEQNKKNANELKNKLEKEKVIFNVKTGKDGKVFGTISTKQISEKLKELNYNIDKKKMKIDNSINTLGTHVVEVELYKNIKANLNVILKEM